MKQILHRPPIYRCNRLINPAYDDAGSLLGHVDCRHDFDPAEAEKVLRRFFSMFPQYRGVAFEALMLNGTPLPWEALSE